MFETRTEKLVSLPRFVRRLVGCVAFSGAVLAFALAVGVLGYRYTADLSWIDSLLNASMILTGMGPVNPLTTVSAKLFASFYALFSGLVFVSVMALTLAPVFHRMLHKFHLHVEEDRGTK